MSGATRYSKQVLRSSLKGHEFILLKKLDEKSCLQKENSSVTLYRRSFHSFNLSISMSCITLREKKKKALSEAEVFCFFLYPGKNKNQDTWNVVTHLWFKNGSYMEYQPIGGTIHKLQENAAAASMPAGEICTFHHPIHYTSDDLRDWQSMHIVIHCLPV